MKPWFKPYPHQKAAVRKLYDNRGKLILAHQMGAGKTVAAVYGFEKLRYDGKAKRALVIVPSGLRMNFAEGGVEGFTNSSFQIVGSASEKRFNKRVVRPNELRGDKDYTIVSYATFRRDPDRYMRETGADTLILDEFHRARSEDALTFRALMRARRHAVNVMGLTASPINNKPEELATLLTLTEGRRIVSPAEFKRLFTKTVGHAEGFSGGKKKVTDLTNLPALARMAVPRVDYVSTEDLEGKTMPRKALKTVKVPMSDEQYDLYELALDRLGPVKKYLVTRDKEISVREAKLIFPKLIQARQIANSIHLARKDVTPTQAAARTPKVKQIVADTAAHLSANPDHKVVLYSNLVRGGVDVMAAGLRAKGIDHALFVGKGREIGGRKITAPVRQQGIKDYKAGKKRVIILSGAGAEGLDLKNSTAFFSLDGHFNPEVVAQAEARARRLGGQQFRSPEKRVVDVRRYQSVVPKHREAGFFAKLVGKKTPRTTDEWVSDVAEAKLRKTRTFKQVMREPHKYLRKYRTASGKMRYVYPKDRKPALRKKPVLRKPKWWQSWKKPVVAPAVIKTPVVPAMVQPGSTSAAPAAPTALKASILPVPA